MLVTNRSSDQKITSKTDWVLKKRLSKAIKIIEKVTNNATAKLLSTEFKNIFESRNKDPSIQCKLLEVLITTKYHILLKYKKQN